MASLQAAIWLLGGRVSVAFGLESLYLIGSVLALIFLNLGKRREGELSAYSVFNPGGERLPGDFNDVLEAQVRRGNII